ncbi:MAG: hypothetical protein AB7T37_05285 [Dehalococcoidia bacterium]
MKTTHMAAALAGAAAILALPVYSALGSVLDPGPPRDAVVLAAPSELTEAFTYQGRLTDNNQPASGAYDFRFIAYDEETGGSQVGTVDLADDLAVSAGVFTTTLSFGPGAFNGDARWLEIAVRPGASTGTYTVLSPRQPISAVPYAIYAKTVGSLAIPFDAEGAVTGSDSVFKVTQTGTTTPGIAVEADGGDGTGAKVSGETSAIEIDGPITVSGASPAAFRVTVDSGANTCDLAAASDDKAIGINSALTLGDPDALVFITLASGSTGHPGFSVVYDTGVAGFPNCGTGDWIIQALNGGALEDGLTFNVLVIKQ